MTTSRQRVITALNHEEPDKVPIDLGGSPVTGMHVSTVYKLRQVLGLDRPGAPVKVIEPFQMLGEIAQDLINALGTDVVGLCSFTNFFGFKNEGWKPWETFDGTPVLVPEKFNTAPRPNGDILMYPGGDKTAPPSAKMPKSGWYFDAIVRQQPIDDNKLDFEDNTEEFQEVSDEELEYFRNQAERLYTQTDKAIFANFGGTGFGDIALVPAVQLKNPKGIRDIEEWYVSTVTRRDYIYKVFEKQCEVGLANLQKFYNAVGNRVTVVLVTGTDFGMQTGPMISAATYRDLYKPFHTRINNWIHRNTNWKTFIHSCGSIFKLVGEFIDAGFDVLNPVQCSAAGMDPAKLKRTFGERITFWGGVVDTQKTLPFGTPQDIRKEVQDRIRIFAPGGGFVLNSVHNIQANIPVENILALYETAHKCRSYPIV